MLMWPVHVPLPVDRFAQLALVLSFAHYNVCLLNAKSDPPSFVALGAHAPVSAAHVLSALGAALSFNLYSTAAARGF